MTTKAFREDRALELRPRPAPGRPGEHDLDEEPSVPDRPSRLWQGIAEGSMRERSVAREGLRDAPGALPFQAELEQALGSDLSGVKAYQGAHARDAADQLGAHAYAMRDEQAIVLGDGAPDKRLVAHEVVHLLQQGTGSVAADEAEADAIGDRLASGERVEPAAVQSGGGAVRKKQKGELQAAFDRFVASAHAELDARAGNPAEVVEEETERPVLDGDTVRGRERTGAVELAGAGATVSSEQRVAELQTEVTRSIAAAQAHVRDTLVKKHIESIGLTLGTAELERQRSELDAAELDPALVAGKRAVLDRKLANAGARIETLKIELAAYHELSRELDAEADHAASELPEQVANRLVEAEQKLRGKVRGHKRSLGFDALAGTIHETLHAERTEHDEAGSTTRSRTAKGELKLGKGIAHESTRSRGTVRRDEHGAVISGSSETTTATHRAIADEQGNVGLGAEHKLSNAIENSFGRAERTIGCNGSVTANFIELPRTADDAEPRYAVVVTIDLGAALQLAASKGDQRQVGVTLGGGVEAKLTQTRVLDAPATREYLALLERAGSGDPIAADTKPELEALSKAARGIASADDIARGVAAQLGSSDAAKGMQVDDATELTTKVTGTADVAGTAAGIGGSIGASGELYRTLKIGRVGGAPGQELVEVAVSFGRSSDLHGSLTASALGVTASAGGKQWDSAQKGVTFRLDAGEADYAALYDEIVATSSPSSLRELRGSRRFAQHVQAYTSKVATGGEQAVGVRGALAMAHTESHERSSEREVVDGETTVRERGAQTTTSAFGLSGLDLLKRSQTDQAVFEIADQVPTLELSESTSESWLGKLDPSALSLTAESPAKAIEKALLETHDELSGFWLDPEDIDVLAHKAASEPEAWANVPYLAPGRYDDERADAWHALRGKLAAKTVEHEPGVPMALARDLARGKAVARFMASGDGARGVDYVRVVLRGWRAIGGADGTAGGVAFEIPPGLDGKQYRDVRRKCKGLALALSTFVATGEDGAAPGLDYISELQFELATVIKQIEDATFKSEPARIEMIAELRELAAQIPATRRDFLRQCSGDVVGDEQVARDELADATVEARHLEETLRVCKSSEATLFARAERAIESERFGARATALEPIVQQLEDQYATQRGLIRQLRAAYRTADTATSAWQVSADARDDRRAYDIDADRFLAVFRAWREAVPLRLGLVDLEDHVATRRARYGGY